MREKLPQSADQLLAEAHGALSTAKLREPNMPWFKKGASQNSFQAFSIHSNNAEPTRTIVAPTDMILPPEPSPAAL